MKKSYAVLLFGADGYLKFDQALYAYRGEMETFKMTLQDMWFVFRNGECVYQALGKPEVITFIRRKLSGRKHKENKRHRWTYQRGIGPFRGRYDSNMIRAARAARGE